MVVHKCLFQFQLAFAVSYEIMLQLYFGFEGPFLRPIITVVDDEAVEVQRVYGLISICSFIPVQLAVTS